MYWILLGVQWNLDITKGQGISEIFLAIARFRYKEGFFYIFCYYWGKENSSLYQGFRYIEVHYIEVPPYSVTESSGFPSSWHEHDP